MPSFTTDGCIIEDQPEHLVLAIRIPKSTINENLGLLAGLAEYAGGVHDLIPLQPAQGPPAGSSWRGAIHKLLFAGFLGLLVIEPPPSAFSMAGHYPPPVEYRGWHASKPIFKVGEGIVIQMQYHRNRHCQTDIDFSVTRAEDNVRVFSTRVVGYVSDLTKDFHDVRSTLPIHPGPGDYIYRGVTHSQCGEGGAFETQHDNVAFKVIE